MKSTNTYTAELVRSIMAKSNPDTITVRWAGHATAIYSKSMFNMIKTDPAVIDIMDTKTGEILFRK